MPTSGATIQDTKKNAHTSSAITGQQKQQNANGNSEKKDNLHPGLKREYELLERYIHNFSGSSF